MNEDAGIRHGNTVDRLFRMDGRVALVTGAAGHLGHSFSWALCEAGAHVILNDRIPADLENLAKDLRAEGHSVSIDAFDLTCEQDVEEHMKGIASEYDRLDILVNNAYAGRCGTVDTSAWRDFEDAYRICVVSAFRLIQTAMPILSLAAEHNHGGASVVNIASMYGVVSPDPSIYGDSGANNPPHYGAAKSGLIQLTRYLACHLAGRGIRVNCISPGPFPPTSVAQSNPAFHKALCEKSPMKRIGSAEELKGALLFLASDAASYVTGVNLPVDGGWTAW